MDISISSRIILITALLCSILLITGCDQSKPSSASNVTETSSTSEDASDTLKFGPVYSAQNFSDPVVEKTVQGARKNGKVVSAEIRGYLVDWVIRKTSTSSSVVEFVVMKDGNVYRLTGMGRPSAGFGQEAPKRLTPEPSREAKARTAALAVAQDIVAAQHPRYALVDPAVYMYIVQIHYEDGSDVAVWVDPDVNKGRFFYDVGILGPIYRVDAITDPFVAKAFSSIETTGSPAVSVQVAGYLVDWVLKSGSDQSIREYAVMKNGRLYNRGLRLNPAGAFRGRPSSPKRETQAEAQARETALEVAQQRVAKIAPKYRKVNPWVYEYLLKIRRRDGSYIDTWVGANGEVGMRLQGPLEPIENY